MKQSSSSDAAIKAGLSPCSGFAVQGFKQNQQVDSGALQELSSGGLTADF